MPKGKEEQTRQKHPYLRRTTITVDEMTRLISERKKLLLTQEREVKKQPVQKKMVEVKVVEKPKPVIYDQATIIEKINEYLTACNKELRKKYPDDAEYNKCKRELIKGGYCHGFTTYRLHVRTAGRVKEYNAMVNLIVNCAKDQLLQRRDVFEAFLKNINRGQHPEQTIHPKVSWQSVDVILDAPMARPTINGNFTQAELKQKIELCAKENKPVVVTGRFFKKPQSNKSRDMVFHSVGFVKQNNFFYIDANHESGRDQEWAHIGRTTRAVWNSMTTNFGVKRHRIGIQLFVTEPSKSKAARSCFVSPKLSQYNRPQSAPLVQTTAQNLTITRGK